MKLRSLIVVLVVTLMANSAFATFFWDVDTAYAPLVGNWNNASNWKATDDQEPTNPWGNDSSAVPNGGAEVKIGVAKDYEDHAGVEATVSDSQVFTLWSGNRMRVGGGARLKIVPGGTLQGLGWVRIGEKSMDDPEETTSEFIQTGGAMILENGTRDDYWDAAGLTIGDGGTKVGPLNTTGSGLYHISGGTLTYINRAQSVSRQAGNIRLGDRGAEGTMIIEGSTAVIDMAYLDIGGRWPYGSERMATGNLEYILDAGGASAIVVYASNVHSFAESVTRLVVELGEDDLTNPLDPILLVNSTGTEAVHGVFDTCNLGSAAQGAIVDLGDGVYRTLTYYYDADSSGFNNDIALVPEPATLALLSLGMFIIRRKK